MKTYTQAKMKIKYPKTSSWLSTAYNPLVVAAYIAVGFFTGIFCALFIIDYLR